MKTKLPTKKQITEFLRESNHIESEFSKTALRDAQYAWGYAMTLDEMTSADILTIHGLLLHRICPQIAGQFRDGAIRIGRHVKMFISDALFRDDLGVMCDAMNCYPEYADMVDKNGVNDRMSKLMHVKFEDIHPFWDGNGRTGRILYNWHRLKLGLPLHIIHADYPKEGGETMEYYKWFQEDFNG